MTTPTDPMSMPTRFRTAATGALALFAALHCAAQALPQASTDLVILPKPATAWRTLVGHWETQAELTGDSVVVTPPTAEYARGSHLGASARTQDGMREAIALEWRGLWQAMLRVESREPLDLRPYRDGSLEFDLDVAELGQGGVSVKVGCGALCERSVNLLRPARDWAGQGWHHVALAMSCFAREGADFAAVKLPFAIDATGAGRVAVANVRITGSAKATLPCPDYRTQSVTPAMLDEAWAIDWWLPRHEQKLKEKAALVAAGTPPELVFIGDSITQGWEKDGLNVWQQHYAPRHALALGFGGDRTENVLWRLQHGEIDGIRPKVAVLMIGTNNTGHRGENPATTAAGIRRLLDEIRQRQPETKILLLAVFPRGEKPDDGLRRLNNQVNQLIASYADGRNIHFLDIGPSLLQADGTLGKDVMPDLLHPNEKGYGIWQRAMAPKLRELLNEGS